MNNTNPKRYLNSNTKKPDRPFPKNSMYLNSTGDYQKFKESSWSFIKQKLHLGRENLGVHKIQQVSCKAIIKQA